MIAVKNNYHSCEPPLTPLLPKNLRILVDSIKINCLKYPSMTDFDRLLYKQRLSIWDFQKKGQSKSFNLELNVCRCPSLSDVCRNCIFLAWDQQQSTKSDILLMDVCCYPGQKVGTWRGSKHFALAKIDWGSLSGRRIRPDMTNDECAY